MTDPTASLPFLTASHPGIGGVLRATLDDFRVDEIAAYEPTGEGEHVYARIEKRDMTTPFAVDRLARALRVDARDIGYAGLKDRHAVTTQWVSLPRVDVAAVEALAIENLRVLAVSRHRNKLRTGHLHGNRFTLRVTSVTDLALAIRNASVIATELRMSGCPNYYGAQRFGREGDNAARGMAWLRGEAPAPRQHFERKLFASAVQSSLFNRYLALRVEAGELGRYVEGELAMRHPTGGAWRVDPAEAQALYDAREASAAGPMFGTRMLKTSGEALAREEAVLAEAQMKTDDFARARDLGEGTRRPVRMIVDDLRVEADGDAVKLTFTLPAGGYATALAREFMKGTETVETALE
jgi:tRNA pseudouridine13 synthase